MEIFGTDIGYQHGNSGYNHFGVTSYVEIGDVISAIFANYGGAVGWSLGCGNIR
jgi:hypothetical protein